MSREILFRGVYEGDNEVPEGWVYGSLIIEKESTSIHTYNDDFRSIFTVNPKSVGQFTGLKTKNGALIFEGDIFKSSSYPFHCDGHDNYVGVIEFIDDEGYCGWYYSPIRISERVRGAACGGSLAELCINDLRVVGTAYENPELLEG